MLKTLLLNNNFNEKSLQERFFVIIIETIMSTHAKNIIKLICECLGVVAILISMVIVFNLNFSYSDIYFSIASCVVGVLANFIITTSVDIYDSLPWQTYLRALIRSHEISNKTHIRISYAYLFRVEIDGEYLLIKNSHGIGKMQPPGHTYKLPYEEKLFLRNKYHVLDDDKVTNRKEKEDYRLRVPAKYLKPFFKRFIHRIDVLKTEDYELGFKETLVNKGILDSDVFNNIAMQYIKRDVSRIEFSHFFQCYEMLVADIIEVVLNEEQRQYLRNMKNSQSEQYIFATDKYIKSCGVDTDKGDFYAEVAEHSHKILP